MQSEAQDKNWVSTPLPFGSVTRGLQKPSLNRSWTKLRLTVVVGGEASPGEIPVALRAPSISPGPQADPGRREDIPSYALEPSRKSLTEGKNRCRITIHNHSIPLGNPEFVTYSCYQSSAFKLQEMFRSDLHILN